MATPFHTFPLFLQLFKQMIASCLVKDPSKRPTSKKLLKHSFFKQARSSDYIARTLLDGLPALGDCIRALKVRFLCHGCEHLVVDVNLKCSCYLSWMNVFNLNVFKFIEKRRRYGCTKENAWWGEGGNIPGTVPSYLIWGSPNFIHTGKTNCWSCSFITKLAE